MTADIPLVGQAKMNSWVIKLYQHVIAFIKHEPEFGSEKLLHILDASLRLSEDWATDRENDRADPSTRISWHADMPLLNAIRADLVHIKHRRDLALCAHGDLRSLKETTLDDCQAIHNILDELLKLLDLEKEQFVWVESCWPLSARLGSSHESSIRRIFGDIPSAESVMDVGGWANFFRLGQTYAWKDGTVINVEKIR